MASDDLFNSSDMFSELDKGYTRGKNKVPDGDGLGEASDSDAPTEVIDRVDNDSDLPEAGDSGGAEVDGFDDLDSPGDVDGDVDVDSDADGIDAGDDDDIVDYSEKNDRPWWDEPKYKIAGGIAVVVTAIALFAVFGGFSSGEGSGESRAGEIVEPTPLAPEDIVEQNRDSGDGDDEDGYRPELYGTEDDESSSSSSTPDRRLPPRDPSMYGSENEPEPTPRQQPAAPVKQQPAQSRPAPAQPPKSQPQRQYRPPTPTMPADTAKQPKQAKPAQPQKPVQEKPSKQPVETVYQTPDRK